MLRIFHNTHYDFVKWWRHATAITVGFILLGLGALVVTGGVNYSIEFTGGTLMQVQFRQPPDVGAVRAALDGAGISGAEIQQFGTNREFTVRVQDRVQDRVQTPQTAQTARGAESVSRQIETVLARRFGADAFSIVRTEAVGPRVGGELRRGALIAVLISFGITLVYLAWRFEWRFGVAAVVATAHDILTTVAFVKLINLEISLTVVAAILTVIGYSLNDTIIIFDRVRENLRMRRKETLYDTLNRSVNETLPRSVMTHVTTLAATLTLLLFAGEVIRPFAWVMSFGIFTGTFSSIYVAAPVLLWIERKWPRETEAARERRAGAKTLAAERSGRSRSAERVGARPV